MLSQWSRTTLSTRENTGLNFLTEHVEYKKKYVRAACHMSDGFVLLIFCLLSKFVVMP